MSLVEALESVDLEPGRTYRCRVHDCDVEIRVGAAPADATSIPEQDVMLDAWCEFPDPEPRWIVTAKPGERVWPDPIEIPPDGDKPT